MSKGNFFLDLKTLSSDNALASQRSSYTNCTLSPSSPSILSEDGESIFILSCSVCNAIRTSILNTYTPTRRN